MGDLSSVGLFGRSQINALGTVTIGKLTALEAGRDYSLKDAAIDYGIGSILGAVSPTLAVRNIPVGTLVNNPVIGVPLGSAASDLIGQLTSNKPFNPGQFILNTFTNMHINIKAN